MSGSADEKPAFEVRDGLTGPVYAVYASGRIEGFDRPMLIFNRIPALVHQAYAQGHADGAKSAETKP